MMKNKTLEEAVCQVFKNEINRQKHTRQEAAHWCGVATRTLNAWLSGERRFSLHNQYRLADRLGMDMELVRQKAESMMEGSNHNG